MQPETVLILYCLFLVQWLAAVLCYVVRLQYFPIIGQMPYCVLAQNFAHFLLWHACAISLLVPSILCATVCQMVGITLIFVLTVGLGRRVLQLFRVEIQTSLAKKTQSWVIRNRNLFNKGPLILALGGIFILTIVPVVLMPMLDTTNLAIQPCGNTWTPLFISTMSYMLGAGFVYLLAMGVLARAIMSHGDDAFGGSVEMKVNAAVVGVTFLVIIGLMSFKKRMEYLLYPVFFALPLVVSSVNTWYPIFQSLKFQRDLVKINFKSIPFEELLSSDAAFSTFCTFLTREFSQENLLFYADSSALLAALFQQVEKLNAGWSTNAPIPTFIFATRGAKIDINVKREGGENKKDWQLRVAGVLMEHAKVIEEKYIRLNAPVEINISAPVRERTMIKLKQAQGMLAGEDHSFFDIIIILTDALLPPRARALKLMKQDSLPRFLLSEEFRHLEQDDAKAVRDYIMKNHLTGATAKRKVQRAASQRQQRKLSRGEPISKSSGMSANLSLKHSSSTTTPVPSALELAAVVPGSTISGKPAEHHHTAINIHGQHSDIASNPDEGVISALRMWQEAYRINANRETNKEKSVINNKSRFTTDLDEPEPAMVHLDDDYMFDI